MKKLHVLVFLSACALVFTGFAGTAVAQDNENNNRYTIDYDAESEQLSIRAEDAELKHLLGSLTLRTGIETLLHPNANKKISVDIDKSPLDASLKKLCQTLNCVVISSRDQDGQIFITRLEVLPTGQTQSEYLQPVVPLESELGIQARLYGSPKMQDMVLKRLEARLERLPPVERDEVIAEFQRKIQFHQEKRARNEQRKKEHQQRREEREAERHAREMELKKEDPERYEQRMRRREERRNNPGRYSEGSYP